MSKSIIAYFEQIYPLTLLHASNSAFQSGRMLGQICDFSGSKTIHKVGLNLSITATDRKTFIVGNNGVISFQAANFQGSRSSWSFQPVLHWATGNEWQTSGTTIQNTLQSYFYPLLDDAITNSPYLTYKFYAPAAGVYNLWGYGYTSDDGIYWSFDNDTTHLRKVILGNQGSGWDGIPYWTKFGSIYIEAGGLYTFTVYLSNATTVLLDQWYFTTDTTLSSDFFDDSILTAPWSLSVAPFNTAVRLRSLNSGQLDDLEDPHFGATSITAWSNSQDKAASSKFYYEIRDNFSNSGVDFIDGVSIDYWQIGGTSEDFASWDYSFPGNSVGLTYYSNDYGQTIVYDV